MPIIHFYKKIANDEIRKISRGLIFANGKVQNFSRGLIFAKSQKIREIAKINPRKVQQKKKCFMIYILKYINFGKKKYQLCRLITSFFFCSYKKKLHN